MNTILKYENPIIVESEAIEASNLGDLTGEMAYLLPGCSDLMMRKTLQLIWRDFCERTHAMEFVSVKPLSAGKYDYTFTPPIDAAVCDIKWFAFRNSGKPDTYTRLYADVHVARGTMIKLRIPGQGIDDNFIERFDQIAACYQCVPRLGVEDVPQAFYDRYGQALVQGALARLFAMTGKPWTDAAQSMSNSLAYENALNDAASTVLENERGEIDVTNYLGWA